MRRLRKTLALLREREQRRTRDLAPAALLAKYLRVRVRPNAEIPHRESKRREASGAKREE